MSNFRMSTLCCFRFRPTNSFSLGPLVNVLCKESCYTVKLLKGTNPVSVLKNVISLPQALFAYKKVIYLDSFSTASYEIAQKELSDIKAWLLHSPYRYSSLFCAGGAHPTAAPLHTLSLGFDIAARGEGEIIISSLVKTFSENKPWSEIPGIHFIKKQDNLISVCSTPPPPPISLDNYDGWNEEPVAIHPPIELVRGCPHGCKYCQISQSFLLLQRERDIETRGTFVSARVRYRSLESVEKTVSHYCQRFPSPVDIRFVCPNSLGWCSENNRTPNIPALWNLVNMIKKYPTRLFLGTFPSEVRPEFVTEETVKILQQCDSKLVAIGAQSGSNTTLKRMARGHNVDTIRRCVDLLLDGDLTPQLDFMIGLPEEGDKDQWKTLNFISELVETRNCRALLHHFMPLPGTPWASAQPSFLSSEIISEIGRLLRHPNVDGRFETQKSIAFSRNSIGLTEKQLQDFLYSNNTDYRSWWNDLNSFLHSCMHSFGVSHNVEHVFRVCHTSFELFNATTAITSDEVPHDLLTSSEEVRAKFYNSTNKVTKPPETSKPLYPPEIDTIKVLLLSAAMHDILDHKFVAPNTIEYRELFNRRRKFLETIANESEIEAIELIADNISFSKEKRGDLDARALGGYIGALRVLVSDADRIDALGLIGVQRCLAYQKESSPNASHNQIISSAIQHCHEKLLNLHDQWIYSAQGKKKSWPLHHEIQEFVARNKDIKV